MGIAGYTDRLSVVPGETLQIMASVDRATHDVDILRLGREDVLVAAAARGVPGRVQTARLGSYARIPAGTALDGLDAFTVAVLVFPTAPGRERPQSVLACWSGTRRAGFSIGLDGDGRATVRLGLDTGIEVVRTEPQVEGHRWHLLAGGIVDASKAWVGHRLLGHPAGQPASIAARLVDGRLRAAAAPILLAALEEAAEGVAAAAELYDGKLEHPVIWRVGIPPREVLAWRTETPAPRLDGIVGEWSLGGDPAVERFRDRGPDKLDGTLVGSPLRAVTGHAWTGKVTDHRFASEQYEAIHFHADDLESAGFEPSAEWTVPSDAPSGLYVAELRAGRDRDRLPFVVRRPGGAGDRALVLLPTFTYLAYANERLGADMATNRPPEWHPTPDVRDAWLAGHPELGRSLYDMHDDGSGVAHTTMLRPIPNMRDDYRTEFVGGPRHLAADRLLLAWLERRGIDYDVICDHDLDRAGSAALSAYRLVVTGSHPEYASARMLDALEQHLAGGGRLAYLGGNGFYWVAATYPGRPHLLEIRRGNSGTRAWDSPPGESHLAATGEPGGLWRHRGRPPNALVGVGFCAQGWDGRAVAYRRMPGADDARAAFVFAGLGDERIGAEGLAAGGAAGDEIDRADPARGTPAGAIVVARSEPFGDAYQPVIEDQLETVPGLGGSTNADVRADMVLVRHPNGGAVFSVGSICWIASLPSRDWSGPTSRVTENVVRAFLAEAIDGTL